MTLPQECGDVIGGVVVPKIREEEEKKRQKKFSFLESQTRCGTEEGLKARGPRLQDRCLEYPRSRPCRGPPGCPRSSRSPPEPLRGGRSHEAPRGLHRPMEQHSSPTPGSIFAPSHLSSVTRPQGDRRIGGRPGWGPTEYSSARRGSLQTGGAFAPEAWMPR